jgi:zinc/manganese transport system permease protein
VSSGFSWNLVEDVRQMLAYHFMLNALRAGTIVAVVAGAIGYLVVMRRQAFAAHTLSLIGFPGAAGAVWLGLNPSFGFFGFCIVGALIIAALPGSGRAVSSPGAGQESAVIGTVQALALAFGFLFVSLFHGFLSDLNNLLFGVITGVTDDQVLVLLLAGVGCLLVVATVGRPLLFSSIDPDVARARGLPVRLLSALFLVVLGVAAAGTSQVTGSLLVFALLVAPPATALRLTARPALGVAISVALSVAVVWIGETIAFYTPYPIGFWVTTLAFAAYLLAAGCRLLADRQSRRTPDAALVRIAA